MTKPNTAMTAGEQLRRLRERFGISLREVELASSKLAEKYGNPEFEIPASRLSDIESKGMLPNIYRLYSLAAVYKTDIRDLLAYFGIAVSKFFEDTALSSAQKKTHLIPRLPVSQQVNMPIAMDGTFNPAITTNLGRLIRSWGIVSTQFLSEFDSPGFAYGYIGTNDRTMSPLLLPGSFLQIDTALTATEDGPWQSEYQRPLYFSETRDEYFCSWCSAGAGTLTIEPHPLSGVKPRTFRCPDDIEIVGQVVGFAMRLGGVRRLALEQSPGVSLVRNGNVTKMAR